VKTILGLLILLVAPFYASAADYVSPDTVITGAMSELQAEMEGNRDQYRENPALLRGVVDKIFLPRFDTVFAAQRVLGKYWPVASDSERQRFIDVFYRYLVNSYSSYLLDFRGDEVEVSPYAGMPGDKYPRVKTTVILTKGDKASVDYVLRDAGGEWKVIDVVVEGISYVRSYREDFSPEIADKGLDAFITRLENTTPELEGQDTSPEPEEQGT
jgi:phospholipid transport system substrate-binding protein